MNEPKSGSAPEREGLTPRIEKLLADTFNDHQARNVDDFGHYFNLTGVLAKHARTLERELQQARSELAHLRDHDLENVDTMLEQANARAEAAERERDELIERVTSALEEQIVPGHQAGGDAVEAANYAFRCAIGIVRALAAGRKSAQQESKPNEQNSVADAKEEG